MVNNLDDIIKNLYNTNPIVKSTVDTLLKIPSPSTDKLTIQKINTSNMEKLYNNENTKEFLKKVGVLTEDNNDLILKHLEENEKKNYYNEGMSSAKKYINPEINKYFIEKEEEKQKILKPKLEKLKSEIKPLEEELEKKSKILIEANKKLEELSKKLSNPTIQSKEDVEKYKLYAKAYEELANKVKEFYQKNYLKTYQKYKKLIDTYNDLAKEYNLSLKNQHLLGAQGLANIQLGLKLDDYNKIAKIYNENKKLLKYLGDSKVIQDITKKTNERINNLYLNKLKKEADKIKILDRNELENLNKLNQIKKYIHDVKAYYSNENINYGSRKTTSKYTYMPPSVLKEVSPEEYIKQNPNLKERPTFHIEVTAPKVENGVYREEYEYLKDLFEKSGFSKEEAEHFAKIYGAGTNKIIEPLVKIKQTLEKLDEQSKKENGEGIGKKEKKLLNLVNEQLKNLKIKSKFVPNPEDPLYEDLITYYYDPSTKRNEILHKIEKFKLRELKPDEILAYSTSLSNPLYTAYRYGELLHSSFEAVKNNLLKLSNAIKEGNYHNVLNTLYDNLNTIKKMGKDDIDNVINPIRFSLLYGYYNEPEKEELLTRLKQEDKQYREKNLLTDPMGDISEVAQDIAIGALLGYGTAKLFSRASQAVKSGMQSLGLAMLGLTAAQAASIALDKKSTNYQKLNKIGDLIGTYIWTGVGGLTGVKIAKMKPIKQEYVLRRANTKIKINKYDFVKRALLTRESQIKNIKKLNKISIERSLAKGRFKTKAEYVNPKNPNDVIIKHYKGNFNIESHGASNEISYNQEVLKYTKGKQTVNKNMIYQMINSKGNVKGKVSVVDTQTSQKIRNELVGKYDIKAVSNDDLNSIVMSKNKSTFMFSKGESQGMVHSKLDSLVKSEGNKVRKELIESLNKFENKGDYVSSNYDDMVNIYGGRENANIKSLTLRNGQLFKHFVKNGIKPAGIEIDVNTLKKNRILYDMINNYLKQTKYPDLTIEKLNQLPSNEKVKIISNILKKLNPEQTKQFLNSVKEKFIDYVKLFEPTGKKRAFIGPPHYFSRDTVNVNSQTIPKPKQIAITEVLTQNKDNVNLVKNLWNVKSNNLIENVISAAIPRTITIEQSTPINIYDILNTITMSQLTGQIKNVANQIQTQKVNQTPVQSTQQVMIQHFRKESLQKPKTHQQAVLKLIEKEKSKEDVKNIQKYDQKIDIVNENVPQTISKNVPDVRYTVVQKTKQLQKMDTQVKAETPEKIDYQQQTIEKPTSPTPNNIPTNPPIIPFKLNIIPFIYNPKPTHPLFPTPHSKKASEELNKYIKSVVEYAPSYTAYLLNLKPKKRKTVYDNPFDLRV